MGFNEEFDVIVVPLGMLARIAKVVAGPLRRFKLDAVTWAGWPVSTRCPDTGVCPVSGTPSAPSSSAAGSLAAAGAALPHPESPRANPTANHRLATRRTVGPKPILKNRKLWLLLMRSPP